MADIVYYDTGYIADGYYTYTADAVIALDNYIVSDYLDADYFVRNSAYATLYCDAEKITIRYVNADAAISSQFTTAIAAGIVYSAQANITCQFSQSATGYRTQEIILTAFSNGALSCQGVIDARTDVTLSSIANISAQADLFVGYTSNITATAAIDIVSTVTRNLTADLTAAFTQTQDYTRIRTASIALEPYYLEDYIVDGYFEEGGSAGTLTATAGSLLPGSADIASAFTMSSTVREISGLSADITAVSTVAATTRITASAEIALSASGSELAVTAINATGTVSITSVTALTADFAKTTDTTIPLSSAVTVSAVAAVTAGGFSDLASVATVSATATRIQQSSADISSQCALSAATAITASASTDFSAIATELAATAVNATGTVLLESQFTLTAAVGKIVEFSTEDTLSGVAFDNSFWLLESQYPEYFDSLYDKNKGSDRFLVAFWGHSLNGTVLDTTPTVYGAEHRISFNDSQAEPNTVSFYGVDQLLSSREIRWYNLPQDGWHHYIFYQYQSAYERQNNEPANYPTTNIQLYVDGELWTDYQVLYHQKTNVAATARDAIALWDYDTRSGSAQDALIWSIGASISDWYDQVNSDVNTADDIQLATGAITQFVAYWQQYTPDITDSAVRLKLYNQGWVNLGEQGTTSGLNRPNVYIGLTRGSDNQQRGLLRPSLSESAQGNILPTDDNYAHFDARLQRRTKTNSYTPTWSNNVYSNTGYRAGSATDIFAPGLLGYFILTAAPTTALFAIAPLSVTATLTATTGLLLTGTAAITSTATVVCGPNYTAAYSADLASQFTQTTLQTKFTGYAADLSSQFTIEARVESSTDFLIDDYSQFTLVCNATLIPPVRATADLSSQATLTAQVGFVKQATADLSSLATVTADATVIPPIRATADLSSQFTVTARPGFFKDSGSIALSAQASIVCNNQIFADIGRTTLAARATMTVAPVKLVNVTANFTSIVSELALIDVFNILPELQIKVPAESRTKRVTAESRLYTPAQETRRKKVRAESRILAVEEENHLNSVL